MKIFVALAALLSTIPVSSPTPRFSSEVIARFAGLPIQEDGRVKPMQTYAHWLLTRLNGRSSTKTDDGRALPAAEWLLEVLFYPEEAAKYEVFLVENDEVLDALGVTHDQKSRRDRYSYAALAPASDKLSQLYGQYFHIDAKERTVVQEQIVRLGANFFEYETVSSYLDAGRPGRTEKQLENAGRHLAIIPPPPDRLRWKVWFSIGEISAADDDHRALELVGPQREAVTSWSSLVGLRDKPAEFDRAFFAACDQVEALGRARDEISKVGLEVTYYRLDLVYKSLYAFGLAFLLCAVWWLRPRSAALRWTAFSATALATSVLIVAITLRCVLRGRPPVSTLYETILFITAVAGIVGLAMECIQRRGMALSVVATLGFCGMYLANRFEAGDGKDTMPMLVAVLDTNFWLATHVTMVTMGYSAGLLAAGIAHVYLLAKFLGARAGDREFFKLLSRTVYGVICFGLFFSLVGTILGGIWANYSWGRFWGWDPKENGALLICLAEIAILHGRMGGYLRELGICMAAIVNGVIVSASWWGVNLLGIGLHSYGFTSGIAVSLFTFWGLQGLVLLAGWIASYRDSRVRAPAGEKQPEGGANAILEPVP